MTTLTKPQTNYTDDWEAYVASLESQLIDVKPGDNQEFRDYQTELAELQQELRDLEVQYFVFNENGNTDKNYNRRLQNVLAYMWFANQGEHSEYTFFLANIDKFNDEAKAKVLPGVTALRDTLNKIIDSITN
jgi:hypothetical protein